jgi:predicted transcriptional regulator
VNGRNRIDWDAAFAEYAAMPRGVRSFGKVAKIFGVSDSAVSQHARGHGWAERVRAIDAKTDERVAERVVRDRSARVADALNAIDLSCQQVLARLQTGELRINGAEFASLLKVAQLLEGEPTDRIQVQEVHVLVAAVFEIAGRYVAPERRDDFVRAVSEFTGERGLGRADDGEDPAS